MKIRTQKIENFRSSKITKIDNGSLFSDDTIEIKNRRLELIAKLFAYVFGLGIKVWGD